MFVLLFKSLEASTTIEKRNNNKMFSFQFLFLFFVFGSTLYEPGNIQNKYSAAYKIERERANNFNKQRILSRIRKKKNKAANRKL